MTQRTATVRVLRAADATATGAKPLFAKSAVVKRRVVDSMEVANQIVATAEATAEELVQRSRIEGRRQGLRDVFGDLAEARKIRDAAHAAAERELFDLAFRIAERVIGRAIERDPDLVAAMVADRAAQLADGDPLTVRVAPVDAPTLEASRSKLAELVDAPVMIEGDDALSPGDFVLETIRGRADARIVTRLELIRQALLEESQ